MSKKAIELSMNTIVVAAIVLIVLIVLIIIFTGRVGLFTHGMNDCGAKGGTSSDCESSSAACVNAGGVPSGQCVFYDSDGKLLSTSDKNKVCCLNKPK